MQMFKRTRKSTRPIPMVHLFLHSANQKYTKGFMTCQMFILYINKTATTTKKKQSKYIKYFVPILENEKKKRCDDMFKINSEV